MSLCSSLTVLLEVALARRSSLVTATAGFLDDIFVVLLLPSPHVRWPVLSATKCDEVLRLTTI